jgi:hypothetical protein
VELEKLQRNSFAMPDFHTNITDQIQIASSYSSKITPSSSQADYKGSFTIRSFFLNVSTVYIHFYALIISNDQIF